MVEAPTRCPRPSSSYNDAVRDPDTGRWMSRAEVAEVPFTAFGPGKRAERATAGGAPNAHADR